MATAPADDRKRVKVYELKNNDWYDRGTGFCVGVETENPDSQFPDARIIVHSEDDPARKLLETRITKDDGYQQQQQTLIVWTESNGVDMALSFQEANGCSHIWNFVSEIQNKLSALAPDGGLSDDDMLEPIPLPVALPKPQLGRLEDVVAHIRSASGTPGGREALVKFIMTPDQIYIDLLAPLVEEAEDLESTYDLHQLCTIMKHLILLNDNSIIEYVVTDNAIMGVLGALEYDPDFPSHRAAHRQFLRETSKFKEIVKFKDPEIRNKIQYTHRLLYLKDVVLARVLDDPTFSVLNSLIFFHHVDIIQYITTDPEHCERLFAIINDENEDPEKKKTAVLFIQNCCAVAKNIQPVNRAGLYNALVTHGLFPVVNFALRHQDAAVRVAGTDVLVSLIDHDAGVVRSQVNKGLGSKDGSLMNSLIELLLVEVDLGVKAQMADAIKILLDPSAANAALEIMHRQNAEMKQRGGGAQQYQHGHSLEQGRAMKHFIQSFYESGAKQLFQPLRDLEHRKDLSSLSVQELSLFTHLIEILCFFVRQHAFEVKTFIRQQGLHARIAQLLRCRKKYMRLVALKWFRTCLSLQDDFHNQEIMEGCLFEPILEIVYETMPRDNLLNSACLEMFEYIKRENIRPLVHHLGSLYRDRLIAITYVPTFQALVLRFDQNNQPSIPPEGDNSFTTEPDTPPPSSLQHLANGRQLFGGLKEDPDEDDYFDRDDGFVEDGADEDELALPTAASSKGGRPNGYVSSKVPLVGYADDDDDDPSDILASSPEPLSKKSGQESRSEQSPSSGSPVHPAEEPRGRKRISGSYDGSPHVLRTADSLTPIKRRREDDEDDEDELGKMMGGVKRRNSSASVSSRILAGDSPTQHDGDPTMECESDSRGHSPVQPPADSPTQDGKTFGTGHGHVLRRKVSTKAKNESTPNGSRFIVKLNVSSGGKTGKRSPSGGGDEEGS